MHGMILKIFFQCKFNAIPCASSIHAQHDPMCKPICKPNANPVQVQRKFLYGLDDSPIEQPPCATALQALARVQDRGGRGASRRRAELGPALRACTSKRLAFHVLPIR